MSNRGFDEHMAALDALKVSALDAEHVALIRKSLAHRNNLLVAKAARLVEEHRMAELMPDLLAAYDRFFTNAEKTDPQCWAKNALSRALAQLDCRDKNVFLRGMAHHQWEPVWGGRSDTAGTLRSNCAHALIGCDGLIAQDVLVLLVDVLADADKAVRVEAARAIAQLGELGVAVLRLRALTKGEEPEVLATCFSAIADIQGRVAIPFLARFLAAGDDAAAEAAIALAETHHEDALAALLALRRNPTSATSEPWFAELLLNAIALTRLPAAIDYLVGLIESEDRDAPLAIESLAKMQPGEELRGRIAAAVAEADSARLRTAFEESFAKS